MSKIVPCLQCGMGNNNQDTYCKECGVIINQYGENEKNLGDNEREQTTFPYEFKKNKSGKLTLLFLGLCIVDVLGIMLYYVLFFHQLQKMPLIGNQINANSIEYKEIGGGVVFISLGVTIVQLLIFNDVMNKIYEKGQVSEYGFNYICMPIEHGILLFILAFCVFTINPIISNIIIYILASGILIGVINLPYRIMRVGIEKFQAKGKKTV